MKCLDPNFDNVPPTDALRNLAIERGWYVLHLASGGFEVCEPNAPGAKVDLNRAAGEFWWNPKTQTVSQITEEQRAARRFAAAK